MTALHHRNAAMAATVICALLIPVQGRADETDGCTTLANSAAAGLANTIAADDQTIKAPQSVTTLSCLGNFYNGAGLNVITNLLDPGSLLATIEGKICSTVQSTWNSYVGSIQCGLTITGFNVGFGGLGGGNFCPKLSFGGGGSSIGSIGAGIGASQSGRYLSGTGVPPSGYTLPTGTNY